MYVPAASPLMSSVVAPLLQSKSNGGVPPVVVTLIKPDESPKQGLSECISAKSICPGEEIVTVIVSVHPVASVTVSV